MSQLLHPPGRLPRGELLRSRGDAHSPGHGAQGWVQLTVLLALLLLALLAGGLQTEALPGPSRDPSRWWIAAGLLSSWFGGSGWLVHTQRRAAQAIRAEGETAGSRWLLAYASQTGTAAEIAERSALALRGAGRPVDLRDLGSVDGGLLTRYSHALFVVATTGDGEPPESAKRFVSLTMAAQANLSGLHAVVLALGDREYPQFCAFGHALQAWLQRTSSSALHPVIEVDGGDPAALARWHALLQDLAGEQPIELIDTPTFEPWRLDQRTVLNPGSQGLPIHLLRLSPLSASTSVWRPGAIATVRLQQDPSRIRQWRDGLIAQGARYSEVEWRDLLNRAERSRLPSIASCRGLPCAALQESLPSLPTRDYSIASTHLDGTLDLLLRETRTPQGELGLGAAWLCHACQPGQTVALHIRENPQFGLPPDSAPLILIGAGTGIAGLRALLRGRMQAGARENWLLFGERQQSCDALFDQELQAALKSADLQRLDRVFSRDAGELRYVQDLLGKHAEELRQWIARGAHLRICGRADTLGKAVDLQLQALLGDATLAELTATGRCRKDVY